MKSKIEWTDATWNPTTGCDKVSAGCKNCYAEVMSKRLQAMGQPKYKNNFQLSLHPGELTRPQIWKKPHMIFVNSMSDLFHKDVPLEFIQQVFDTIRKTPQHTYQILTKRAERLAELAPSLPWSDNVWMGVSVENQKAADERIWHLLQVPAAVRFLSCEPLLGPLRLWALNDGSWHDGEGADYYDCLTGSSFWANGDHGLGGGPTVDWVIVGGESGPNARPMHPDWARSLRDQCRQAAVPFLFKQWGEYVPSPMCGGPGKLPDTGRYMFVEHNVCMVQVGKKIAGRELDGQIWHQFPQVPV